MIKLSLINERELKAAIKEIKAAKKKVDAIRDELKENCCDSTSQALYMSFFWLADGLEDILNLAITV